jgi:hypothetical protein
MLKDDIGNRRFKMKTIAALLSLVCLHSGKYLAASEEVEECFLSSPGTLTSGLTIAHNLNGADGTVTIQLVYEGQAWLGVGRSPDGDMVGGEAIIGVPDSGVVQKYNLNSESTSGVVAMDDASQTLIDASIDQNATHTVLTYTKLLQENGELSISQDALNTWIYAVGSDNTFPSIHRLYNSFEMQVKPCSEGSSSDIEVQASKAETYNKWLVHGIFMGLAWGVFVPLAIGASMARKLLPGNEKKDALWFQLHRGFNMLAVVFTIIGFSVAVAAFQEEGNPHFSDGTHTPMGLVLFLFMLLQATMGFFRPAAPASTKTQETSADEDAENDVSKKSSKRKYWEYGHRFLGLGLFGLAWYVAYTGIEEFEEYYFKEVFPIFYGVFGSMTGLVILLALVARFRNKE